MYKTGNSMIAIDGGKSVTPGHGIGVRAGSVVWIGKLTERVSEMGLDEIVLNARDIKSLKGFLQKSGPVS